MYGKSARRSSLFLLELMISILMFSVASAWCVRLFVTARYVVSETEEQNRAQNLAAGYAEMFLASMDFEGFLLEEGAKKEEPGEEICYRFWYDGDWNASEEEDAAYYFEAVVTRSGDFEKCSFSFSRMEEEETIYLLDVEKYTGGEAAL